MDQSSGERIAFGEGLWLRESAHCVEISSPKPLRVVSSALIGGGVGWGSHFCNFHVHKDYASNQPAVDLEGWLNALGHKPSQSVAMMTAVRLEQRVLWRGHGESGTLLVAVTAGTGNAVDITALRPDRPSQSVGTINIQLFLDAYLTDGALINACQSATEAKVHALAACGIQDSSTRTLATGTSTDCLCVAATQRGQPTPYAGSATPLGLAIGRGVFQAVCQALNPSLNPSLNSSLNSSLNPSLNSSIQGPTN